MIDETWYKMSCPHCQAINWINNGDTNDLTVPDVEAVNCWKCKGKFWIDDEGPLFEFQTLDNAFDYDGKKSPD